MNLKLTRYKNVTEQDFIKGLQIKSADVLIAKREIQLIKQMSIWDAWISTQKCVMDNFLILNKRDVFYLRRKKLDFETLFERNNYDF